MVGFCTLNARDGCSMAFCALAHLLLLLPSARSPLLQRGVALLAPHLDDAPASVLGDPSRICGILLNLYTNAGGWLGG